LQLNYTEKERYPQEKLLNSGKGRRKFRREISRMILLDNTALSAFAHIDRLDLPSKLFGEAFIPESVYTLGSRGREHCALRGRR